MIIKENQTVLFQGDSITDCGRSREDVKMLGGGYANMVAALFSAKYPEMNVKFINKGISGNRVKDLKARWSEDCIDIKPDVVSIMIGINDTWRRYDSNDPTSAQSYEEDYRFILNRIKTELPGTKIIILEPFVLPVPEDRKAWREDLDDKITAARALAREFGAIYIPLDGLFAAQSVKQPPAFWAADGVHPSQAGHAFVTSAWMKAISD